MKKSKFQFPDKIIFPIQIILYWLLLFLFFRILFFTFYNSRLEGDLGHQLYGLFFAGFRVDLSTASYLSAVPILFWIAATVSDHEWPKKAIRIYNMIIIPLVVSVLISNLGLYGSWGTLLNRRLLLYLENPSEVSHFMETWKQVMLPIILILASILFVWLSKKTLNIQSWGNVRWKKAVSIVFIIPLTVIAMRGGFGLVPVNESASSYSPTLANNHMAINPAFYFAHSVSEYFYLTNKYIFFSPDEAQETANPYLPDTLSNECGSTVLKNKNCNVVIILLESWTADLLSANGELKGVAPFTDSLIHHSIYFKNAYASGYRTDQGLVSIMSGYPSQPDNTIISYPSKTEKLESIYDELKKENYATSFFYGGDVDFANMRLYLLQHSMDEIKDKKAFDESEYNSKWGAHDEAVFNKQLEYLKNEKEPFLSSLLTLSTHEPFDVPMETPFNGSDESEKFKKSAWYTDQCLKKYFAAAQKEKWYDNTLFILVADHGHYLPMRRDMSRPESKKVTLLFTGNVIEDSWKGKTIERVVAQHDIAGTLMNIMGRKNNFPFSRNMFCDALGLGFYCNENSVGVITEKGNFTFYYDNNQKKGNPDLEKIAKAYLQVTYADFIAK